MTTSLMMKMLTGCAAGVLFASGVTNAAAMTDQQRLIEQMKIEELLTRSTRAIDSQDIDGWIATFTADGEWDTQYVTCKGPQALRAYATKGFNCIGAPGGAAQPGALAPPFASMGKGGPGGPPGGPGPDAPGAPASNGAPPAGAGMSVEHFVSQPQYEFIDDHTCHYTAYWMTVSGAGEMVGGKIISVGHYDDTLVKVNGKWLIQKRQIKH